MQCAFSVLFCLMWPAPSYNMLPRYLTNDTICGKIIIEHKICFDFSLQVLSETFLIFRRIERDMIKMCVGLHVKYPLLL
jgi:hypothetical protein